MNSVFPAPPEMEGRPDRRQAQRQHEGKMADTVVKANGSSSHDRPLEGFAPPSRLHFKDREDRWPENRNCQENAKFEFDTHPSTPLRRKGSSIPAAGARP